MQGEHEWHGDDVKPKGQARAAGLRSWSLAPYATELQWLYDIRAA